MDNGQLTMDNEQWIIDNGQFFWLLLRIDWFDSLASIQPIA